MKVYDQGKLTYGKGDVVRIDYQERYAKKLPPVKSAQQDKVGIVLDIVEKQNFKHGCDGEVAYYIYRVLVGIEKVDISEEDLQPVHALSHV